MKNRLDKKTIMNFYYSDKELLEMEKMSPGKTLRWLSQTNRFFNRTLSKKQKKLQDQLASEGW
ncbi:MAG: hypothetical protein KKH83_08980 [Candidatus Margulisbacteria bacterium]|nr:hypothetical protein [Candidatus Margulisiibacteriota bacterium]